MITFCFVVFFVGCIAAVVVLFIGCSGLLKLFGIGVKVFLSSVNWFSVNVG